MEKEICIFKCNRFLNEVHEQYQCGGIWVAKIENKRKSFICGREPEMFMPAKEFYFMDYVLFVEEPEKIDNIESIVKTLEHIFGKD